MTASDRRRDGRLARRARETRVAFGFALIIMVTIVLSVAIRSQAGFACAAASIATASARCAAEEHPLPAGPAIRVVFPSDASEAVVER